MQLQRAVFESAPEQGQIGVGDLLERYRAIRALSVDLCSGLGAEDCQAQSMPDASPLKWHLAHTSWFFEMFLLARDPAWNLLEPAYASLFNSYYNSVGPMHARPQRGLLTRPTLDAVLAYRARVDEAVLQQLRRAADPEALDIVELGLHHEQQHQELMLTDIKHLFWCNPLLPAYRELSPSLTGYGSTFEWIDSSEGLASIGHGGAGFCFDNEQPRHRTWLLPFAVASRPVTNAEYREFIRDGGYRNAALWLSDGWAAVQAEGWTRPLYWHADDGEQVFTLGGLREWQPDEPACHLSYYEADAFARWAGARLPSEAEWEHAAGAHPIQGNFLESGRLHPVPVAGEAEWFGNVWQWTHSAYAAYPGYRPGAGALGEYNGKFMCNQLVLRGGSCASSISHLRSTYRNFFYPAARWQFSGLRLAKDG